MSLIVGSDIPKSCCVVAVPDYSYQGYKLKPDNHEKKHCYKIKIERDTFKSWGAKPSVFHPNLIRSN